jgi:MFS transporter, FSR family, fosmidomycin resistance protein
VERELALSHSGYVVFAFALPLVVAAALEAGVALYSDRARRDHLVLGGQCALAAALFFTAWTSSGWGLAIGLALAGASSGVACGAAQVLVVVTSRHGADRAMVRWALFSSIGDILTPLITAAAIAIGHSYRGALLAIAALVCAQFATSAAGLYRGRDRGETARESEPPTEAIVAALARAARLPRLWMWLFAAASCTLMDELVVAFAVLRLERERGTSEVLATSAAAALAAGSIVGAAMTDRVVSRVSSRWVLVISVVACASSLTLFLSAEDLVTSSVALFLVGATSAPHHPLAFSRAYQELPNNPGTVQALAQVFVVVELLAPIGLGVVADRWGLSAALAVLVLQPVVILVVCAAAGPPPAGCDGAFR